MSCDQHIRRISREDTIPISVLRDFLLQALRHDAIGDVLIERMASRAERGSLDVHGLSALLPELIDHVLDAASNEDWMAIADLLIDDMRDVLLEEVES